MKASQKMLPSFTAVVPRLLIILLCLPSISLPASSAIDPETLLNRMKAAYAEVSDYQTDVEVRIKKKDGSFEEKKFLYTFKKPDRIRLDFRSPHPGMIVVYPDKNGKVIVQPSGWARFFVMHLAPGSSLLGNSSNQRIDQTDLGLLIKNICHSLTDQRRGPVKISESDGAFEVQVLAEDHFRKGVETLYHFFIDKTLWLPIEVEEFKPAGALYRTVIFRNLKVNPGIPDIFFKLNGG
jgi:outer membrane lipoprotein-sorting protein